MVETDLYKHPPPALLLLQVQYFSLRRASREMNMYLSGQRQRERALLPLKLLVWFDCLKAS